MKILYVTTIGKTMRFFEALIKELVEDGFCVDIATNETNSPVPDSYRALGCNVFPISFSRSPLSPGNAAAYGQLKKVIENGGYDIVHCHTPNAAVITRLVCRSFRKKHGLKVFYTAHGFHFYKGAPKLNWMIFYPIEKLCSRFTDKLITINSEDFELAKNKFKSKEVHYVPGVGINLSSFVSIPIDRKSKRYEIGVPEDAFLLLSVGELNENKNHRVIVEALAKLNNPRVHYAIAGVGDKKESLINFAESLGVADRLHLLGYRNDVAELNHAADLFCLPSIREGLPVAPIEALACGVPVVAAKNRGTNEIVIPNENGFLCEYDDADAFASSIIKLMNEKELYEHFSDCAPASVKQFDIKNVIQSMKEIYEKASDASKTVNAK